jgi:radical SAM superfamily enzyme with C-terminal helix-hairpin-helix motif
MIKEVVEDKEDLENFVIGLIAELRKDKIKNWKIIKELLNRWTLINQFNVNKRLQLEAVLLELK